MPDVTTKDKRREHLKMPVQQQLCYSWGQLVTVYSVSILANILSSSPFFQARFWGEDNQNNNGKQTNK